MKIQSLRVIGSLTVLFAVVGISRATTVGFVGAAATNAQIPTNYGSNAVADGTGWTTSDGTGATPDVILDWTGGTSDWEFHGAASFNNLESQTAGGAWDKPVSGNAIAQLQGAQDNPLEINFSVPAGIVFVLNSLDIGNATDQSEAAYGWNLRLVRDSDAVEVYTHSTPLFTAGQNESVAINFTGDPGEDYTLNFDRNPAAGIMFRSGLDNLSFSQELAPGAPAYQVVLNRDTGSLTLENFGTGAGSFLGYSITSAFGALDQDSWLSITENYDAGSPSGPDQIDPDDNWTILSDPDSFTDLSEAELDGGDGATIAAASSVILSSAGGWQQNPNEDVVFELLLPDGEIQNVAVLYEGNGGNAFEPGDMDFSGGTINALDWQVYNAGRGVDLTGLSPAEAYQMGDLDDDGDNDIADFLAFKALYEADNGAGSFAALSGVPEPTSVLLLIVGAVFLGIIRSGRIRVKTEMIGAVGLLVVLIFLPGTGEATTITFSGASNADIPADYGSNIGADAPGFVTTDGTGQTYDIGLTWAPLPNVWEFHNSDTFGDNGFEVAVGQIDVDNTSVDDPTILFETAPGVALTLHSLDIGNAIDQTEPAYSWTISLIRASDSMTVFTHTTALLDETPFIETVSINYTGDPGEDYTLLFDDGGANTVRSAIDNLSFSQVAPDPLSMIVNRASGRVVLRNDSGLSVDTNSYEIKSASDSLDPVAWHSLEEQDYEGNGAPGTGDGWEEAGGIGANQLIESYLLASSVLADGEYVSLGNAFDHDKVGVQEDLDFGYHRTDLGGYLIEGSVEYIDGIGDMNGDGLVDENDVNAFVQALTDRASYDAAYPLIEADLIGDVDESGSLDLGDVSGFKALISGGGASGAAAVPEPAGVMLLCLCLAGLAVRRPGREFLR